MVDPVLYFVLFVGSSEEVREKNNTGKEGDMCRIKDCGVEGERTKTLSVHLLEYTRPENVDRRKRVIM